MAAIVGRYQQTPGNKEEPALFYCIVLPLVEYAKKYDERSIVVRCYVPEGGQWVKRDNKARANKLVCL